MKPLLNLTIERRWLDMIASGEKREEYRCTSNLQVYNVFKRGGNGSPFIVLRAGYRNDSESIVVELEKVSFREFRPAGALHPEWGEWHEGHYVLHLGKVLKRGTYAECKKWMEEMR